MVWIGIISLVVLLTALLWRNSAPNEPSLTAPEVPELPPTTPPPVDSDPVDPRLMDPLAVRPLEWHCSKDGKIFALAYPRSGFESLDRFSDMVGVHMDTLLRLADVGPDVAEAAPPIAVEVPPLPELEHAAFSGMFDDHPLAWLKDPTWNLLRGRITDRLLLVVAESSETYILYFALRATGEGELPQQVHPHLTSNPENDPTPVAERFARWRGRQVEPLRTLELALARVELFAPDDFPDLFHFIAFASQRDQDVDFERFIRTLQPYDEVDPRQISDLALAIHTSGFCSVSRVFEALVAVGADGELEWFGAHPTGFVHARTLKPTAGAADLLRSMKAEKSGPNPWKSLCGQLGGLVLGEADRERLWRRAHRGEADEHRSLSSIVEPTPAELRRMRELIRGLESGR